MTWPFENDTSAITKKLAQRSWRKEASKPTNYEILLL